MDPGSPLPYHKMDPLHGFADSRAGKPIFMGSLRPVDASGNALPGPARVPHDRMAYVPGTNAHNYVRDRETGGVYLKPGYKENTETTEALRYLYQRKNDPTAAQRETYNYLPDSHKSKYRTLLNDLISLFSQNHLTHKHVTSKNVQENANVYSGSWADVEHQHSLYLSIYNNLKILEMPDAFTREPHNMSHAPRWIPDAELEKHIQVLGERYKDLRQHYFENNEFFTEPIKSRWRTDIKDIRGSTLTPEAMRRGEDGSVIFFTRQQMRQFAMQQLEWAADEYIGDL